MANILGPATSSNHCLSHNPPSIIKRKKAAHRHWRWGASNPFPLDSQLSIISSLHPSLQHECHHCLDQSVSVICSTAAFAFTQIQLTLTLSSILLFLSLVSFIPQYHRILSRRDCSGICLHYVLFNLIAVTEQFALGLHYIVDNVEVSDTIVSSPPTVGDWLNLWQLGVVWACHSAL